MMVDVELAGESFYRGIRWRSIGEARYEISKCRRCGRETWHLAGRTEKGCISCRENRPKHKHRSKHGHRRKQR